MIFKVLLLALVYIIGELRAANIKNATTLEHFCQTPPEGNLSAEWVNKVNNEGPPTGLYVPLFSKNIKTASQEYEWTHTRSAEEDRRAFCPRIIWRNGKVVLAYNEQRAVFICTENTPTGSCPMWQRSVEESTYKEMKLDRTTAFFPLTDNQSYIFAFRCWEDGYRDWSVLSPKKILNSTTQEIILKEVDRLGFDREEFIVVNYENCEE